MEKDKKMTGVMLPTELVDRLQAAAASENRSLSGQIRQILQEWVEKYVGDDAGRNCSGTQG